MPSGQTVRAYRVAYATVLAIACLIVPAAVAGCGAQMTPQQQSAMTTVRAAGGRVYYEGGGYVVDLTACQIEDEGLKDLNAIGDLKSVNLRGTPVTDAALPYLQAIATLKTLNVERTAITPAAIAQLKKAKPELLVKQ
ncbi:MAG: hypothetical protein WD845_01480 [Pirellulales bacterium]